MKDRVARNVSCCFLQLSLLKGCTKSGRERAIAAIVTSQVDRCNNLMIGSPNRLLDCLQSVLHAAARWLCNRRKYDHVTPLLRDGLYWFPVPLRIEYKVCLLVYKSLHGARLGTCAITASKHTRGFGGASNRLPTLIKKCI